MPLPSRLRRPSLAALLIGAIVAGCAAPAPTQPRAVTLSTGTCPSPSYPAEARQEGVEGTNEVSFDVDAAGKVTRVAIVRSAGEKAGHRALDALAIDTVRRCSFPAAPGFLTGSSRMAFVWRLQDGAVPPARPAAPTAAAPTAPAAAPAAAPRP